MGDKDEDKDKKRIYVEREGAPKLAQTDWINLKPKTEKQQPVSSEHIDWKNPLASLQIQSDYKAMQEKSLIIVAMGGQGGQTSWYERFSGIFGFKKLQDFYAVKDEAQANQWSTDETRKKIQEYRAKEGTVFDLKKTEKVPLQKAMREINHPLTQSLGEDYPDNPNAMILDMIAGVEHRPQDVLSGECYDMVFGSKNIGLTNMTVGQVLEWGSTRKYSGAGRYQFMNETLDHLVKVHKIPLDTKFDENLQDRLALIQLDNRGYQEFLSGNLSASKFGYKIACEWAGLPAGKDNMSRYGGINQAHAKWDDVLNVLKTRKKIADFCNNSEKMLTKAENPNPVIGPPAPDFSSDCLG